MREEWGGLIRTGDVIGFRVFSTMKRHGNGRAGRAWRASAGEGLWGRVGSRSWRWRVLFGELLGFAAEVGAEEEALDDHAKDVF